MSVTREQRERWGVDALEIARRGGMVSPDLDRLAVQKINGSTSFREALEKAERMTGKQLRIMEMYRGQSKDDPVTRRLLEKTRQAEMKTKIEREKARMIGKLEASNA